MLRYLLILFVFIFVFVGCSEIIEQDDGLIPSDVAHPESYYDYPLPPEGFSAGLAWMQAIHDNRYSEESTIEIDYFRFYAHMEDGDDLLLATNECSNNNFEGGLYSRDPWFGTDFHTPINYELDSVNGFIIIKPSEHPDNIMHWWNNQWPRASIPAGAESCWVEARIRITGPALVQAGMDYWKTPTAGYAGYNVNNIEGGVSDWALESDDWQIVRVGLEQIPFHIVIKP